MNTGGAQSTRGYNHNCPLAPGTRYLTSFPGGLTTSFCLSAICDIIPTSRIWLHAVQQRWSFALLGINLGRKLTTPNRGQ